MKYSYFLISMLVSIPCSTAVAMEGSAKRLKGLTMAQMQERYNGQELGERLIQAVCHQTPDDVRALLADGASFHYDDLVGRTALNHAVIKGRVDMLQLLLDAGADVNYRANRLAPTVLQHVICYDREDMLPMVIAAGLDVQSLCAEGWLQWAARHGNEQICLTLAEEMFALPDEAQKKSFDIFMRCLKRIYPGKYHKLRDTFEPDLLEMIKEENMQNPDSEVHRQIHNIEADETEKDDASERIKEFLMDRYCQGCSIEDQSGE